MTLGYDKHKCSPYMTSRGLKGFLIPDQNLGGFFFTMNALFLQSFWEKRSYSRANQMDYG